MLLRSLLSQASPAAARGRLTVLIYHRVLPRPDPLFPHEIDAEGFDRVCAWLRAYFEVLPLDEACTRLAEGRLPARAAAISFDDGYADNHDIALPILRRHGLAATFFVATGFIDGGIMWNDVVIESVRATACERLDVEGATGLPLGTLPVASLAQKQAAIAAMIGAMKYLSFDDRREAVAAVARAAQVTPPSDLMMRTAQLRGLQAQGMTLGGHTRSHPILARLAPADAQQEILDGKRDLERMIDREVTLFAYPNGRPGEDFGEEHAQMVRAAGFRAAVTTGWGAAGHATDLFRIPRFTPWDRSRTRFALRLLQNLRRR